VLRDVHGREYLDANSSIWTNLHGHNHPKINSAISRQLKRIAHSSALGLANEPATQLAAQLVTAAAPSRASSRPAGQSLKKVFFSDDGSTAMEVALKLAYEFSRRSNGDPQPKFLSLEGAYHGDTIGATALGHLDLFHRPYAGLLFKTDKVMAPYCYRCPFNRAKPERADARTYRKCHWECLGKLEQKFAARKKQGKSYAAFVVEPLIQGAAGMIPQPEGWLRQAAEIARSHGALIIADEVMTAFGRVGFGPKEVVAGRPARGSKDTPSILASHQEKVEPDFAALAKGLTGGYLPMAATLTTKAVFDAFLGEYREFKTFFHGHSYTGNQLGAAAGLASLELWRSASSIRARRELQDALQAELQTLWALPKVGDIRQVGLVAGIELVKNWRTRQPFALRDQVGIRICEAMARRGVLTRPIGNVIVLMPPFCTTRAQARQIVKALREAIGK
jgi:adenosylmethionine-8-amino-7-oxononanoate aminotransferase